MHTFSVERQRLATKGGRGHRKGRVRFSEQWGCCLLSVVFLFFLLQQQQQHCLGAFSPATPHHRREAVTLCLCQPLCVCVYMNVHFSIVHMCVSVPFFYHLCVCVCHSSSLSAAYSCQATFTSFPPARLLVLVCILEPVWCCFKLEKLNHWLCTTTDKQLSTRPLKKNEHKLIPSDNIFLKIH